MLVIDSVRCLTCMYVGRDLDTITVWACSCMSRVGYVKIINHVYLDLAFAGCDTVCDIGVEYV